MFLDCRLGPTLSCLVAEKKVNFQLSYFLAITTKPSSQVNMEEGMSKRIDLGVEGGLGEVEEASLVKVDQLRRISGGGVGQRKDVVVVAKRVADLEIYIFSATKQDRVAPFYSPETCCFYLRIAVHTLQCNWIYKLRRYLML